MPTGDRKGPAARLSLYLRPPELAIKLKFIAVIEGKTVAELLNEAAGELVAQRELKYGTTIRSLMKSRGSGKWQK